MCRMQRDIHLSIISHGQMSLVNTLLEDLAGLPSVSRLQLTLIRNVPEKTESRISGNIPIKILDNASPLGFCSNQNLGFRNAPSPEERRWFGVVNPDIRLRMDVFPALVEALEVDSGIGVAAPRVVNPSGRREDSARLLPTPGRLAAKVFGYRGEWPEAEGDGPFEPDWVAGMFMLFRAEAFEAVGGYDEGFFLYYDDVDICSRVWLAGYRVRVVSGVEVVHDARRQSRRNPRYAIWHMQSMMRFLRSDVRRQAEDFHKCRNMKLARS